MLELVKQRADGGYEAVTGKKPCPGAGKMGIGWGLITLHGLVNRGGTPGNKTAPRAEPDGVWGCANSRGTAVVSNY